MPAKKRGVQAGSKRETLTKVLAPYREQFRKASRKPKGKLPSWFQNLSPHLQAQVRQEAFKADTSAMPSADEIGRAVLAFWSK